MKFEAKHFKPDALSESLKYLSDIQREDIAYCANAYLNQWLAAAPTVVGDATESGPDAPNTWHIVPLEEFPWATHTAKLVCIEALEKE